MSDIPSNLRYAKTHEWIRLEDDGTAYVGISDHAQDAMGDLVYVQLPDTGVPVSTGDEVGVVESVKAASDIYSPVDGEIIEVNSLLEDAPETVNEDPYGRGWIFRIRLADKAQLDELLGADDYQEQLDNA
ncbi:MAG: glycine cleavage system protein GcvH [Gammaproteobacteria bacterium]